MTQENEQTMRPRELHSDYYRDRWTERELCRDFPGDAVLIDGLHTMQTHFWHNNVPIEIPIVRVMNTAHYLAAYMFATTCSGDQTEYEALASMSLGRDRRLCKVAIIVLAAMLERTDGFRARQCRTLLLDNRDPDFDEGVTLYDRFLKSAEKRFAEEDFLIDTQQLIKQVNEQKEIIEQQSQEIQTLKYTITTMENQKPQTIVYNYGTYNDIHDNPNSTIYACPESDKQEQDTTSITEHFCHITQKCVNENRVEAVEAEIRAACKGTAEGLWRTLWDNENLGYVEVQHIDATKLYGDIENRFGKLPFKERQFRAARNKRNV